MSGVDLSVVIPTYRRPAALARTLEALARQAAAAPFEVVICDDGSPPEDARHLRACVDGLAASLPAPGGLSRIRVVRQENAGPAAARNAGARAAAGPLLLFLDDDCAPADGLVALHQREHHRTPEAAQRVAVLGHVAWSRDLRVTPFMELVTRGAQFNFGAIADRDDVPFTCFYTANCSLWRADLDAAGWFDASLPPYLEDTEFGYRLTRSGTRIVYRPEALVYHEHAVELAPYLERQRRAGRAAVQVALLHPELFDVVGVGGVADLSLREQFYAALLRYAFVVGVEEALSDQVAEGGITGAELRSRFERWVGGWALRQAGELAALRDRVRALEAEVQRRDRRLAEVTQQRDAQIAVLEADLARFHRLPPVALYRALRARLDRMVSLRRQRPVRHNA
jgi:GT2 family glycosyltransferase